MSRWLDRLARKDNYELVGTTIVRHLGWFRQEQIALEQVASWRITHEMGFDVVSLDIGDKEQRVWLDWDNDLVSILRSQIAESERSAW